MGCTVNGFLSIYKVYQGWGLQRRGPSDPPKENGCKLAPTAPIVCFTRCFLWSRDCLPPPSVSKLSLTLCRYLSMVTRSSSQSSVDDFRRERLQRLATFDSFSVTIRLEARSRMESTTTVLPRRNLEAIGAVGANLRPFSFGGSVGPLRWSPQPW